MYCMPTMIMCNSFHKLIHSFKFFHDREKIINIYIIYTHVSYKNLFSGAYYLFQGFDKN